LASFDVGQTSYLAIAGHDFVNHSACAVLGGVRDSLRWQWITVFEQSETIQRAIERVFGNAACLFDMGKQVLATLLGQHGLLSLASLRVNLNVHGNRALRDRGRQSLTQAFGESDDFFRGDNLFLRKDDRFLSRRWLGWGRLVESIKPSELLSFQSGNAADLRRQRTGVALARRTDKARTFIECPWINGARALAQAIKDRLLGIGIKTIPVPVLLALGNEIAKQLLAPTV
jgi:hypothetical protein